MQAAQNAPLKPTRATRHNGLEPSEPAQAAGRPPSEPSGKINNSHARPNHVLIPAVPAVAMAAGRPAARAAGPTRHVAAALQPHTHTVGHSKPLTIATSSAHAAATPQQYIRPSDTAGSTKSSSSDRNIDKVVLGNICFRAWYPSYYGKEVLGDASGASAKGGNGGSQLNGGSKDEAANKTGARKGESQPILDRLYVCPCCFKYSKELVTWWEHVRVCEKRSIVPGDKIYIHPKGTRTKRVEAVPSQKLLRGKRGSIGAKMVEEIVHDEGEWSIWEVDGEKEAVRPSPRLLPNLAVCSDKMTY